MVFNTRQLRSKTGQTIVEYAILLVIVLVVFFVMQSYIKRGMQGRYKSSVDDLGEQYDPRYVNGYTLHTYQSASNSVIQTVPGAAGGQLGYWTNRVDASSSTERKTGFTRVGIPHLPDNSQ